MHNLQGKAGGIVLVWFREEKAATRERQWTFCTEKVVLKASGLVCSSWAMWDNGSDSPSQSGRLTPASLQQAEVGNLLKSPSPALP